MNQKASNCTMWPQFLFPFALCLRASGLQRCLLPWFSSRALFYGPVVKLHKPGRCGLDSTLTHASVVPQVTQRRVTPAAQAQRPAQRANTAARCVRAMASEALPNGTAVDERVEALRKAMQEAGVDAYIVPSEDAHMVGCCELTLQPAVKATVIVQRAEFLRTWRCRQDLLQVNTLLHIRIARIAYQHTAAYVRCRASMRPTATPAASSSAASPALQARRW